MMPVMHWWIGCSVPAVLSSTSFAVVDTGAKHEYWTQWMWQLFDYSYRQMLDFLKLLQILLPADVQVPLLWG